MWLNPQFTSALVAFTEEILNEFFFFTFCIMHPVSEKIMTGKFQKLCGFWKTTSRTIIPRITIFETTQVTPLREKCPDTTYFWSVFSCIRAECRRIRTSNISVFGHFSRSAPFEFWSEQKETSVLNSYCYNDYFEFALRRYFSVRFLKNWL